LPKISKISLGYGPYGYKIPANQLEICKHVWPTREYGLYGVCVRRESTVLGFQV